MVPERLSFFLPVLQLCDVYCYHPLLVRPPIASLKGFNAHAGGLEDGMACVVEIPILAGDAALGVEALVQGGAGVGGQDVEGGRFDTLLDGPFYGVLENVFIVVIHAKDETGVYHHAQVAQTLDGAIIDGARTNTVLFGGRNL